MFKPIVINKISLSFPGKLCFENFSATIHDQARIAIIGANGGGKSSLLQIISGQISPSSGQIQNIQGLKLGIVPQLIGDYENLSGGEKFNKALSQALSLHPDILLLDEPTNHLDARNRKSLMGMINNFRGAVIVVSHDEELLRNCIDIIWHIDNACIEIFSGDYDDYKRRFFDERQSIEEEIDQLKREKKSAHKSLMREQERASKSKARGEKLTKQKRWLPAVADQKASYAAKNAGKKNQNISDRKQELTDRLASLRIPEIVVPSFSLNAKDIGGKTIVSISQGRLSYGDKAILENINLSLDGGRRAAIVGDNGSGKSALFKALLAKAQIKQGLEIQSNLTIEGFWDTPLIDDIGYLDQYYGGLDLDKTVYEIIADLNPSKDQAEIRNFLNDFLFRKNEEVNKRIKFLSGGEKARLCLARIAAKTPKLLLIDEITNNIDLQTKEHVRKVLKDYPGSMLIISHDESFLRDISADDIYLLQDGFVKRRF